MSHVSFSQLTAYTRCGKQYQLQRIMEAPEEPSVWLPAGKAIHSTIEQINLHRHREGVSNGNSPD